MTHTIVDTDKHFLIDPTTRKIKNMTPAKNAVMQYDHKSERFSFSLPKMIEGHDMMECNRVEVHYINIDKNTNKTKGVYEVDDMKLDPKDESKLVFSWLITQKATQREGSLSFLIRFACIANDGNVNYVWNTAVFSNILVSPGFYNSPDIVRQHADVLEQWKKELMKPGTGGNVTIDPTLTIEGAAADAKAVGDMFGDVEAALDHIIAQQEGILALQNYYINVGSDEIEIPVLPDDGKDDVIGDLVDPNPEGGFDW